MGVHGLWKLIEPSGRVIPLEKMSNKVLAIDVSIWLHQAMKGMHDVHGAPVAVAHLLVLFHRLCKLLFYKIKPIFVFDGGVPALKRNTMAQRRQQKTTAKKEALKVRDKLLKNILKHEAVRQVLTDEATSVALGLHSLNLPGPAEEEHLYKLPPLAELPADSTSSEEGSPSSSSEEEEERHLDIYSVDLNSNAFKSLPADVRHDILSDLKDTRKQNSWRHLEQMPKASGAFSNYQMDRLLKRRAFQVSLDEAGKELGGKPMSLQELEELLDAQGVLKAGENIQGNRIAQDSVTRYMLIKKGKDETPKVKEEVTETVAIKAEPKDFKIEEHLQEVDWSSEDECGKKGEVDELSQEQIYELIKRKDQADKEVAVEPKNKVEKKILRYHEKMKEASDKLMKQKQNDIADILTVLEDGDLAETEVREVPQWPQASSRAQDGGALPTGSRNCQVAVEEATEQNMDGAGSQTRLAAPQQASSEDTTAPQSRNFQIIVDTTKADMEDDIFADIFANPKPTKGESCFENVKMEKLHQKEVPLEITNFQDKPDVQNLPKLDTPQAVEIVLDFAKHDKENDIFADIFANPKPIKAEVFSQNAMLQGSPKKELPAGINTIQDKAESKPQAVEIVLDFAKHDKENDIFADIFANPKPIKAEIFSQNAMLQGSPKKELSAEINTIQDKAESKPQEVEIVLDFAKHDKVFVNRKQEEELIQTLNSEEGEMNSDVEMMQSDEEMVDDVEQTGRTPAQEPSVTNVNDENTEISKTSDDNVEDCMEAKENDLNEDGIEESSESNLTVVPTQSSPPARPMSEEELKALQVSLESEQSDLLAEQGRQNRQAQSLTDQMCSDAQELLRLFGVPFVVAPMEAEAQCAALDSLGLTEGTITDDSDIWLFGGRTVYKNFFNQKKHVLEYRNEDIHKYFKLAREDLIKLALLVGSDYTPGLNAVGPVTALEILAAFPCPGSHNSHAKVLDSLGKFRAWLEGGCKAGPARVALRSKIKNTTLIPGFPSSAVVEAYLNPDVDDSKEPFSWAKPNLELLQSYAKLKFGWSVTRSNELLMPVMKKLLETTDQTTIDKYFRVAPQGIHTEGVLSKRVEKAVKRLGREYEPSDSESDEPNPPPTKKAKTKNTNSSNKKTEPETIPGPSKVDLDYLKKRLHKDVKIPQKESTKKILDDRKKRAAELFKESKKKGNLKRRTGKVVKEVKLSESSSDAD